MPNNHDRERQIEQQGPRQYEADELTELRREVKDLRKEVQDLQSLRLIVVGDGSKKSQEESLQTRVTNIETSASTRSKLGWVALAAAVGAMFDRIAAHFSGKP